jgi:hypothetical protein
MKISTRRILRFISTAEVGLSVFLVFIVFFVFILPPLGVVGIVGRLVVDIVFTLLLISGIASVSERKVVFVIVVGISIITLILRWSASFFYLPVVAVLDNIATIVVILLLCTILLARVFKKGPVTFRRIEGAIAAYLLLGISWAYAYQLIADSYPASFAGAVTASTGISSWMYFSFVTLATLGYGDISPVHPIARSLATAEAITGQLYLAILIARLVSQELFNRQQNPEDR